MLLRTLYPQAIFRFFRFGTPIAYYQLTACIVYIEFPPCTETPYYGRFIRQVSRYSYVVLPQ